MSRNVISLMINDFERLITLKELNNQTFVHSFKLHFTLFLRAFLNPRELIKYSIFLVTRLAYRYRSLVQYYELCYRKYWKYMYVLHPTLSFARNDNDKIVQSKCILYILKLSYRQIYRQIELVTGKAIQGVKRVLET